MDLKEFTPLSETLPFWPSQLVPEPDFLSEIGVSDFTCSTVGAFTCSGTLVWCREIVLGVAGIDWLSLVVAYSETAGFSELPFEIDLQPVIELRLPEITFAFRFAPGLLKPVELVGGEWAVKHDAQGEVVPAEVVVGGVGLTIDGEGDFRIEMPDGAPQLTLPASQIGDTGLVIEVDDFSPYFARAQERPAPLPADFRGFTADSIKLHLPKDLAVPLAPQDLVFTDVRFGTDGFSGKVEGQWTPAYIPATRTFQGSGSGTLFGIPFALKSLAFEFQQSAFVSSEIKGELVLPFFDERIAVDLSIGLNGAVSVAIAAVQPVPATVSNALLTVEKAGVIKLELDSLGFSSKEGVFSIELGGKLTPRFGDFNWPSFDVKKLTIDSEGKVDFNGGWINLPTQYSLDFNGFQVEITKFGFGRNDDGTKWIGMSGGVELVKGLPAGASVEGLRITANDDWSDPKISFDGVGVALAIPGVLQFKGEVSYREFNDPYPPYAKVRRFDGDITLRLEAIDLMIDGTLVAGKTDGYNYMALYVNVDLPTGIPFGPSGLAFYGFAGLMALQMKPNRAANEPWYALAPPDGWYDKNPVGIEHLSKWTNAKGNKAFGAGVSFGTLSDNGHTVNGRVLLAVVLPGPVVMLQGAVNLLKDRSTLAEEAMFKTLAVFDKPAGSILLGVDAKYDYPADSGKLISIKGGLEAFYSYQNQSDWHLYLGLKTPRESRIQARALNLFDAEAYFMIDPDKLEMGSWIGYSKQWKFSVLSVTLEAWMENNAVVSFKPLQLSASLYVHGSVKLKAYKYGLGLTVDARIAAEVFRPKHLLGEFQVSINLPKPFKDISADVRLEWGPEPLVPPTPNVLKDVAIEHLKSSAVWPLPAGKLLVPDYNDNGFLKSGVDPGDGDLTPAAAAARLAQGEQYPVVPMDCRPSIAFSRNVWDDALLGTLPQPPNPEWEQIGDPANNVGPARVRYGVGAVYLQRYEDGAWQTVATADGDPAADPQLFGTWQVTSGIGGAGPPHNKMLLWSTSGLDQYRNTSADVTQGAISLSGHYPCPEMPTPTQKCLNFNQLNNWTNYPAPYAHPDNTDVRLGICAPLPPGAGAIVSHGERPTQSLWTMQPEAYFKSNTGSLHPGVTRQIYPSVPGGIFIAFAQPLTGVNITASGTQIGAYALTTSGVESGPYPFVNGVATIPVANVMAVSVVGTDYVYLAEICATFPPQQELVDAVGAMIQHNQNAHSHWYDIGEVLEPFSDYRLRIDTTIRQLACDGSYDHPSDQTQYAYFRTNGPPGLGKPSVPLNDDPVNFDSGLDNLSRYVRQTVPPTVPAGDGPPLSPRPVYCGYDVGVDFNENYVSLMYRMAGRDLSLILYDRNNLPMRDSGGNLVAGENPWDVQPTASLSYNDSAWTSQIAAGSCIPAFNGTLLPHDQRITQTAELTPDMRYEARLVPMLIHEDFGRFDVGESATGPGPGASLGRWHVGDASATNGGPSQWKIILSGSAHRIEQQAQILPLQAAPAYAGTMLALGAFAGLPAADPSQPANWSDYRLSLDMRSGTGSVGVAFRFADASNHYVFLLNSGMTARLVRVAGGVQTLLAEENFPFSATVDYHVVIEAIGADIRVSIDGALVLEWTDTLQPPLAHGGIALYASGGKNVAFADIRAHDFSDTARSAYMFSFTSSAYLNFFHHMHSFHDGCWRAIGSSAPPMSAADFAATAQLAVSDITSPVTEKEALAFEALAHSLIGTRANQDAVQVEVSKVERGTLTPAMLVRGPQPFGFRRGTCELLRSATQTPTAISPLEIKLVEAAIGVASTADEFVTILLGEGIDPSGYVVERRDYSGLAQGAPVPIDALDDPASAWTTYFVFPQGSGSQPRGHQLRIYSCAPFTPSQIEPRTRLYFRTPTGQTDTLELGGDAVDLRIRAPDGSVIHARRFLKDSAYAPVGVKWLRKRDETAFIMFPVSGVPFTEGSYRLKAQYRRDNSAVDHGSLILSQSGDASTEAAALDFSWQPFA